MARTTAAPAATQEDPTRPRATDASGRVIDDWGLPLSGPARARALGDRADPAIDPTGWKVPKDEPLEIRAVDVPPDIPPAETPADAPTEPAVPSPPPAEQE